MPHRYGGVSELQPNAENFRHFTSGAQFSPRSGSSEDRSRSNSIFADDEYEDEEGEFDAEEAISNMILEDEDDPRRFNDEDDSSRSSREGGGGGVLDFLGLKLGGGGGGTTPTGGVTKRAHSRLSTVIQVKPYEDREEFEESSARDTNKPSSANSGSTGSTTGTKVIRSKSFNYGSYLRSTEGGHQQIFPSSPGHSRMGGVPTFTPKQLTPSTGGMYGTAPSPRSETRSRITL